MGLAFRHGNEVHHYTNSDFDRIGRQALTRLLANIEEVHNRNNKEESVMELTATEVEGLIIKEFIDKRFWAILENNGMLEVPTVREAALVRVQKAPRHPGYYLVTAA